jgi:hypothetical protein
MLISRLASRAAIMLAASIALSPIGSAAGAVDTDQIAKFLSDAKMQSFTLMEDATDMQIFTFSTAAGKSHEDDVRRIKTDVEKMERLLAELQENKGSAAPSQLFAIERIATPGRELTATLTKALAIIESHPQSLSESPYRDYLSAVAETAGTLSSTITNYVDYGKAKERLDALAQQIDPKAGS